MAKNQPVEKIGVWDFYDPTPSPQDPMVRPVSNDPMVSLRAVSSTTIMSSAHSSELDHDRSMFKKNATILNEIPKFWKTSLIVHLPQFKKDSCFKNGCSFQLLFIDQNFKSVKFSFCISRSFGDPNPSGYATSASPSNNAPQPTSPHSASVEQSHDSVPIPGSAQYRKTKKERLIFK